MNPIDAPLNAVAKVTFSFNGPVDTSTVHVFMRRLMCGDRSAVFTLRSMTATLVLAANAHRLKKLSGNRWRYLVCSSKGKVVFSYPVRVTIEEENLHESLQDFEGLPHLSM